MSPPYRFSHRWRQATVAVILASILASAGTAADSSAAPAGPTALTALIARLSEQGVLSKADTADLLLLAEADAAEARAQAAAVQAAEAKAAAAEARARAYAAMLNHKGGTPVDGTAEARALASARQTDQAVAEALARRKIATPPELPAPSPAPEAAPTRSASASARVVQSPPPVVREPVPRVEAEEASAPQSEREEPVVAAPSHRAAVAEPATETAPADDAIHVTYVPEVVKQQLREEVKQEVLEEARAEGWATPRAVPDWVSRFRFFGDFRFRETAIRFPTGNDLGGYINFNAINTGPAFDVTDQLKTPFPYYNVDQDRNRLAIRARLGAAIDLSDGFSSGIRIATGENNSPVTQNQGLGVAGSGQGGNFSKYALWLDRAFLRYEIGGLPDEDLAVSFGRFDNPFMTTTMLWADDLGFDGLEAHGRYGLGEDITSFFALGAFPVFNTDLNFSTNQVQKFPSHDKWLLAAQLGVSFDLGSDISMKIAAAYYPFSGIEGKFSTPFTPITANDPGDTDATRPAFAQKGNTYMPLRDIIPGPLNGQGTTNQFQYFGLASKFKPLAVDMKIDFNHFQPFQISLSAQYVKNLAFDAEAISQVAINNLGPAPAAGGAQPFLGTDTAWIATLVVGSVAPQKRWDWNVGVGYRSVGSDALVDGFADSDFGGGGTNVKGLTVTGSLALSSSVWLGLRWMSAQEVAGPRLKSDIFQLDLNGRY